MDNKPLPVAVADWTAEAVKMALCCASRKEPPNEYEQLRKALQRKQEEVRRLHSGERSSASLRDVARCVKVFKWFARHLHANRAAALTSRFFFAVFTRPEIP